MPRQKVTAAEYIERHDAEMRIILGELVESAAQVNLQWAAATQLVKIHPERALEELANAWVALTTAVPVERRDALRRINAASALLDLELPDDEETTGQGTTPRKSADDARLGRLEPAGLVKRGVGPPPVDLIAQPGPALPPGDSVVDALLEERRDGW